jgi:hypothetical protein
MWMKDESANHFITIERETAHDCSSGKGLGTQAESRMRLEASVSRAADRGRRFFGRETDDELLVTGLWEPYNNDQFSVHA